MKTYTALKTAMNNLHAELADEVQHRVTAIMQSTGASDVDLEAADCAIVYAALNDQESSWVVRLTPERAIIDEPGTSEFDVDIDGMDNRLLLDLVHELDGMLEGLDKSAPRALAPELQRKFEELMIQMSPENLSCDGELPHVVVKRRFKELNQKWKILEIEAGRTVSEDEVVSWLKI